MDGLVDLGEKLYNLRLMNRLSWAYIGNSCGLSESGARKLAHGHAVLTSKPWPLERITKGGAIYSARKHGMTWLGLSRCYRSKISIVKRQAYKYARREGLPWPIR